MLARALARFAPNGAPLRRRDWQPLSRHWACSATPAISYLFIHSIHETTASNAAVSPGADPGIRRRARRRSGMERPRFAAAWLGDRPDRRDLGVAPGTRGLGTSSATSAREATGSRLERSTIVWASYTVLGRDLATRYGAFKSNAYPHEAIGTIFFLPFGLEERLRGIDAHGLVPPRPGTRPSSRSVLRARPLAYCAWYYAVPRIGPTGTRSTRTCMPVCRPERSRALLARSEPVKSVRQLAWRRRDRRRWHLPRSRPSSWRLDVPAASSR